MNKSKKYNQSRRKFIKTTAFSAAALSLSAKSYNRILGSNDRINFAVVGVNGRGQALVKAALEGSNTSVSHICDVDSRAIEASIGLVNEINGSSVKGIRDYRSLLDIQEVDAIAIASPDHWHASMAIMAVRSGKDVYVEKPTAHNPHEGEMMVKAQEDTGKVMQVGTQQRSAPTTKEMLKDLKERIIGEVYFAKCWYSNTRDTIGHGQVVPVPEWLDWELWQGPAPRKS